MRTVRIDFTADNIFPNGNYVGRIGEHNATQLAITLLPEMLTGVNYHVACFSVGEIPVSSRSITGTLNEDGAHLGGSVLYIPLWQALTANASLSLTVEAYAVDGETVEMIAKTAKVTFSLSESVPEVDPESTEAQGMAAQVAALAEKVDDLDETVSSEPLSELGDDGGGNLTYKGKTLVGGDFDISTKADKVTGATADNLAGIDASGNLKDSGKKADDFVAVVAGKGLSTNDYTTAEKLKLNGIAENADVSQITAVQLNGQAITPSNKTVNIAPNLYTTPTVDGSTITLENNKEYNISLADDATIALPSAPGTTYSGTILLLLTCTADINLTFDVSVKLDSGVSTATGYHEILITYHPGEGKWWVRQTPEVT